MFISYSQEDKTIADAVCASLEAVSIRCWIATRDPSPGGDWAAEIVHAIDASKVFVLVFSGHCNGSVHVRNELLRAVNQAVPIIPFRVKDEKPAGALALHLEGVHWLDALTPPFENHLRRLAELVTKILSEGPPDIPEKEPRPPILAHKKYLLLVALLAVAVLTFVLVFKEVQRPETPSYVPEMSLKEMLSKSKPKKGDFLVGPADIIRTSVREPLVAPPDANQSVSYPVRQLKQTLKLTFGQIRPAYPFCIEMIIEKTKVYPRIMPEFAKLCEKMLEEKPSWITESSSNWAKYGDWDRVVTRDGAGFACQAGFHDFDGDGFPEIIVCLGFAEFKDQTLWLYEALGPTLLQVWKFHPPAEKKALDRKENWQLILSKPFQSLVWIHGRQITTPVGSRYGTRYTFVDGRFVETEVWRDENGNYNPS